jgi:nitroimidazol reductase NimA-like FMN-containing flavoprotein (pyridoxamine 5'-phosphate oxidase superfamily)
LTCARGGRDGPDDDHPPADEASQDRGELDRLLDSVHIGHFALVAADGQPVVLPTAVVRDGDRMLARNSPRKALTQTPPQPPARR